MEVVMDMKKIRIESLNLPYRVERPLKSHGIRNVSGLIRIPKYHMVTRMRWMGYGAIAEIDAALEPLGLKLSEGKYWSPGMENELLKFKKKKAYTNK